MLVPQLPSALLYDVVCKGVYDHHQGSDIVLPFYLSSLGYGFLWNHASFGGFDSSPNATTWTTDSMRVLDFWVTTHSASSPNPYKEVKSPSDTVYPDADALLPANDRVCGCYWPPASDA